MTSFDSEHISVREKLILTGLFLSKFDVEGLDVLGFGGFVEAYNAIGLALGGKPASIKNYRDEFDPLFPNSRKGWHKRSLRDPSAKVLEKYQSLNIQAFSMLIRSFFDAEALEEVAVLSDTDESETSFARRLITGMAAERYFEQTQPHLSDLSNYEVENTTRQGCGYDFRLHSRTKDMFLAVEVKGLREKSGGLALTQKEHRVAGVLQDRFYLFVVKNFREIPFHEIYQNPLKAIDFERKERVVVQVSWAANI